jgi:hypothetical protein
VRLINRIGDISGCRLIQHMERQLVDAIQARPAAPVITETAPRIPSSHAQNRDEVIVLQIDCSCGNMLETSRFPGSSTSSMGLLITTRFESSWA